MSQKITPTSVELVRAAMGHLRAAQQQLREAGAKRTADRVAASISSAAGALRHAENKQDRERVSA